MQGMINRRGFLKTAAAGAAVASLPAGTALASFPRATTTVEFWNPSGDALGGPLIKKLVAQFNNGIGKREGIYIDSRFVSTANNSMQVHHGHDLLQLARPDHDL